MMENLNEMLGISEPAKMQNSNSGDAIRNIIETHKKEYLKRLGIVKELSDEEATLSNHKFRHMFTSNCRQEGYDWSSENNCYVKWGWAEYAEVSDEEYLWIAQMLTPLSQTYLQSIDGKLRTIKHIMQFFLIVVIVGLIISIIQGIIMCVNLA